MVEQSNLTGETRQVTRAAALISIGNIISRALGLIRDMAQSYFFGAGGAVSAFNIASQVPTMLYDQLVGGMLNSSLVPVFSDYASDNDADGLWLLLSNMLTVVAIILAGVVLLLEIFAHGSPGRWEKAFLRSSWNWRRK